MGFINQLITGGHHPVCIVYYCDSQCDCHDVMIAIFSIGLGLGACLLFPRRQLRQEMEKLKTHTVMARNTSFIFIYKSIITYYNPIYGIISP